MLADAVRSSPVLHPRPRVRNSFRARSTLTIWAHRHIVARHPPCFRHEPFWHEPAALIYSPDTRKKAHVEPVDRREFLALAAAAPLMQAPRSSSMFVCMHEISSDRFDFKTAMEGYAKAGIRAVEPLLVKVREFSHPDVLQGARTGTLPRRASRPTGQIRLFRRHDDRQHPVADGVTIDPGMGGSASGRTGGATASCHPIPEDLQYAAGFVDVLQRGGMTVKGRSTAGRTSKLGDEVETAGEVAGTSHGRTVPPQNRQPAREDRSHQVSIQCPRLFSRDRCNVSQQGHLLRDGDAIQEIDCRETKQFLITRDSLNSPEMFFKHLFGAADDGGDA
jgi:hypothetical protein